MSELSFMIESQKDNVINLMMNKKKGKVVKILFNLARQVNENNKLEYYNFLGELLQYNCDFFYDHAYKHLSPKLKKPFMDEQLIELEKYLIENYCLVSKEEVLASSNAVVKLKDDKLTGRVYLTNMRMIGLGRMEETSSRGHRHTGLITAAIGYGRDRIRKKIRAALKQRMGGDEILFFGHQIPINETTRIKNRGGDIVYVANLEFEKKSSVVVRSFKVRIIPKPLRKEPGKDFRTRRVDFLSSIEVALRSLQQAVPGTVSIPVIEPSQITPELRQGSYCPDCGKEVEIGSTICENCGGSVPQE